MIHFTDFDLDKIQSVVDAARQNNGNVCKSFAKWKAGHIVIRKAGIYHKDARFLEPAPRKRGPRSDRGKTHVTRTPSAIIQERTFAIDPNRPVEEQFDEVAEKMAKEIPLEKLDELLANK